MKSFKWRDDLFNTALDQKIKWNEMNRMSFCFIFSMYWDLINEGLVGLGKMEKLDQWLTALETTAVQVEPHQPYQHNHMSMSAVALLLRGLFLSLCPYQCIK